MYSAHIKYIYIYFIYIYKYIYVYILYKCLNVNIMRIINTVYFGLVRKQSSFDLSFFSCSFYFVLDSSEPFLAVECAKNHYNRRPNWGPFGERHESSETLGYQHSSSGINGRPIIPQRRPIPELSDETCQSPTGLPDDMSAGLHLSIFDLLWVSNLYIISLR